MSTSAERRRPDALTAEGLLRRGLPDGDRRLSRRRSDDRTLLNAAADWWWADPLAGFVIVA